MCIVIISSIFIIMIMFVFSSSSSMIAAREGVTIIGGMRCAELGGGWSAQSFSEMFGIPSPLLNETSYWKTSALAEKSKNHRDICLTSGWSGPLCMSLTALPSSASIITLYHFMCTYVYVYIYIYIMII